MGFLDLFKTKAKAVDNQLDPAYVQAVINYWNSFQWSDTNNVQFIKLGYRYNSTVYSIIKKISNAAKNAPVCVYKVKNQEKAMKYKRMNLSGYNPSVKSAVTKNRALDEVEPNDPLYTLLERPNPRQSWGQFLEEMIGFYLLTGNIYVQIIKPEFGNNAGMPKQLYNLPSQYVQIKSTGDNYGLIDGYVLTYNGEVTVPVDDVLHISAFNPDYDGTNRFLYGQSPLLAGMRMLDTNNEALTTAVSYLKNQTPKGVLSLVGQGGAPISPNQAKEFKERYDSQYKGSNKAGTLPISPYDVKFTQVGLSVLDLAVLDQLKLSQKELCNIYGVPITLMNSEDASTYNNIDAMKKDFYSNAIMPIMSMIKDEFNRAIAVAFGNDYYIDFDYSGISELQDDQEKVSKVLNSAYWITIDEKRRAMGYDEIENSDLGDEILVPASLVKGSEVSMDMGMGPMFDESMDNIPIEDDSETDREMES